MRNSARCRLQVGWTRHHSARISSHTSCAYDRREQPERTPGLTASSETLALPSKSLAYESRTKTLCVEVYARTSKYPSILVLLPLVAVKIAWSNGDGIGKAVLTDNQADECLPAHSSVTPASIMAALRFLFQYMNDARLIDKVRR